MKCPLEQLQSYDTVSSRKYGPYISHPTFNHTSPVPPHFFMRRFLPSPFAVAMVSAIVCLRAACLNISVRFVCYFVGEDNQNRN